MVLDCGFPWWLSGKKKKKKKSACQWRRSGSMPGSGRSPGEGNAHSNILALEIPWTEDPGRLQSMWLQKSWTWLRDWTTTNSCILVLQLKGLISLVKIPHIFGRQISVNSTCVYIGLWAYCNNFRAAVWTAITAFAWWWTWSILWWEGDICVQCFQIFLKWKMVSFLLLYMWFCEERI